MSIPAFLRYPKSAASTVVDEFSHPNTAKFERNLSVQDGVIDNVKLRSIASSLPGYETLSYGYDKAFWVDGKRLSYPLVVYIGYARGTLWACPDGNVIRETKNPFKESSIFWTAHTASYVPLAPSSKVPDPFDRLPVLRDGLTTPMGAEAQALIRYYTILRAQDSDLTKYSMEFPDPAVLLNVFRLLVFQAAGHVDRGLFIDTVENHSSPEEVAHLPSPPNIGEQCSTNRHARSSDGSIPAIDDIDASFRDETTAGYDGNSDAPVQSVHKQESSPTPTTYPTITKEFYSREASTKHQDDLTALLERKADIQVKIEERYQAAEGEEEKARTMLHLGSHRVEEVRACLDEATRLRSLSRDDQKEIDAIDKHLSTSLRSAQPTQPSTSKREDSTLA